MKRMNDYFQGMRTFRELRLHAPEVIKEMIYDLDYPISPPLERVVACTLDERRCPDFRAAEVLLPAMMKTFAFSPHKLNKSSLEGLESVCNICRRVGHCWRAMRDHAGTEVCREFCPNVEAFTVIANNE
ncbi:hypothetical protein HOP51_01185 [Halomonas sp. MCCC 1A11036]|uniref:Uncharacterized protein n=1 Tax=Billgrantia zhangzhouensis TaxID=2733481 RepID=A0ABS9AAH4_9GAMM|nr:hypothetical protein [Halomonas zhangzhouensis]MCE8018734.1 hypothetical protein [Halomonas zhangzhouensis]